MFKAVRVTKSYHLTSWNKAHPNLGIDAFSSLSDPVYYKSEILKALSLIKTRGGEVGQALYKLANDSNQKLEIVCWPGLPGEFICDAEVTECVTPTIMWDPFKDFRYYTRQMNGAKAKIVNPAVMPAWMVLAHELGHYNQYMSKRQWYAKTIKSDGGVAEIESDNLELHEAPLQRVAGYGQRSSYQDFVGGAIEREIQTKKVKLIGTFKEESLSPGVPSTLASLYLALDKKMKQKEEELEQEKKKRTVVAMNPLIYKMKLTKQFHLEWKSHWDNDVVELPSDW